MRIDRGKMIQSILASKGFVDKNEISEKTGIKVATINSIFAGRRTSIENLEKLSKLIGQDITYLNGDYQYGVNYKL